MYSAQSSVNQSPQAKAPVTHVLHPLMASLSKSEFLVTEASWEKFTFLIMKISPGVSRWQGSQPKQPSAVKFLVVCIE